MMDVWARFARTGTPSSDELEWPPYHAPTRAQMMLGPDLRVEQGWRAQERAVWDGVF